MQNTLQPGSFLPNFDRFLSLAVNLRDLRLDIIYLIYQSAGLIEFIMNLCINRLAFNFNGNGSHILPFLKSILKNTPQLERLVLLDESFEEIQSPLPDWNHPVDMPDFFVDFAAKMKRLVCFCISFNQIDGAMCEEVNRRVAEKVVGIRPSLWFHFGRYGPDLDDPEVPLIHLQEILLSHLDFCLPPPKF